MKLNRRFRKIGIIIAIVIVAISILGKQFHIPIITTAADLVLYPIQKSIIFVSSQTSGIAKYFKHTHALIEENKLLRQENEKLVYENTLLAEYKNENYSLKDILDMKQRYREYDGIGANVIVIGKEAGNWYKMFDIDRGTQNRVKENSVILASGGLVGHVLSSSLISSKVLPIIDDRSSVAAKIVRTGDKGILKGDIELTSKGLCRLEINIESEVVKGDQVITSHLSSIYPPGIPIGTVEEIVQGKNGLTQYAYVRPIVDFKHLEQVLVIMNSSK